MTIDKHKLSANEIAEVNVKSNTGTRLTGTAQQNKHVFDRLGELIAQKLNELIDSLTSLGVDKTLVGDNIKHLRLNQYQQLESSADGEVYTVAGASHEIQDEHGNIMPSTPVLRFAGMNMEQDGDATIIYGNTEYPLTFMSYADEKLVITGAYRNLPNVFFATLHSDCTGAINGVDFSDVSDFEIDNASSFVSSKMKAGRSYLITFVDDEKVSILDPSLSAHGTAVTPGTYGGLDTETGIYKIPSVTVDEYGRVSEASNSTLPKASAESDGYLAKEDFSKIANLKVHRGTSYAIGAGYWSATNPIFDAKVSKFGDIYFPRVLAAMVHIKVSADSGYCWIPAQFHSSFLTDSMDGRSYVSTKVQIPPEYWDYNIQDADDPLSGVGSCSVSYMIIYETGGVVTEAWSM